MHVSRLDFSSRLRWSKTWEPAGWSPRALLGRCRDWIEATRRRRAVALVLIIMQVIQAITTLFGGSATARTDTVVPGKSMSAIDGLAWTDVKDSSGIPLSNYLFATRNGNLANPEQTVLSVVLDLEFMVFMVIVISAIWLTGYVVSFRWLEWLAKPLQVVGDNFTHQVATPIVITLAASIGAFYVAWFVLRGYHAKAVLQVVTMLAIAVLGATYLAKPLAAVLSPDGLLVQGRNVGIAVAAGLNGNSAPQAESIVDTLNGTLADNFARHPLQVWNFGHLVDDFPSCRAAWSSGVLAGSESQVTRGMRDCGDSYAYAKIQNPSMGQIGTGLVLLTFATILLLFLSYLAIKVFLAAVSSVFHALLAGLGFVLGYIWGEPQAFLIRNIVSMVGDAGSMVVHIVFLGGFALLLDNVFRAAAGSGIAVIFVGGMLLIAGFVLLRRLDLSLLGGQSRIAEQIRAGIAGESAAAGAGGASTGMTEASLRYTLSPNQLAASGMRMLNNLNMVNANPVTSWLFRRPNPFTYFSKQMQDMNYLNYELLLGNVPERTAESWMGRLTQGKNAHDAAARAAVQEFDGLNHRAAAAALTNVFYLGGDGGDATGALRVAGFSNAMTAAAIQANRRMTAAAEENPVTYAPLARVAAALELADTARGFPDPAETSAYVASFTEAASLFRLLSPRPLYRDSRDVDQDFVNKVQQHWDRPLEDFKSAVPITEWGSVSNDTRHYIGSNLARDLYFAAERYAQNPTQQNLADAAQLKNRAMSIDLILSNTNAGPWTN